MVYIKSSEFEGDETPNFSSVSMNDKHLSMQTTNEERFVLEALDPSTMYIVCIMTENPSLTQCTTATTEPPSGK